MFSVQFLEKYHHICFHPCFRDASFCYALCVELGKLFRNGFISCFRCSNVSFRLSALVFSVTEPITIMWSLPILTRLMTVTSVTMLGLLVMMWSISLLMFPSGLLHVHFLLPVLQECLLFHFAGPGRSIPSPFML